MTKKKIEFYIVKLERPSGISQKQMSYYLKDAIDTWNGSFNPSDNQDEPDPLFGFRCKTVKVIK